MRVLPCVRRPLSALLLGLCAATAGACEPWPAYEAFMSAYLSADGRVVDRATDRRVTVSEGQAYALFFALAADDRRRFARILGWTRDNLAAGDLAARLPAWQWGQGDDGRWTVLDDNSAADADVWLAYDLLEAGVRWRDADAARIGRALAARIVREETRVRPPFGRVLLPGRRGFLSDDLVRINPSYLPLPALRRIAALAHEPGFAELAAGVPALIGAAGPHGVVPDWFAIDGAGRVVPDPVAGTRGAWDAIRVYLWVGLTARGDPARRALLNQLAPMGRWLAGHDAPPLEVDAASGELRGQGPEAFAAALVPFARARGEPRTARRLQRLAGRPHADGSGYYADALRLFALGDGRRFRFAADGRLLAGSVGACAS